MIIIIDYGLGNLNSVARALRAAGADTKITSDIKELSHARKLILPGVGAFHSGMIGLSERNLINPIKNHVAAGKYLLGLCLGMQLLFDQSQEFGQHSGLAFIEGTVKKLAPERKNYKIPHIGWNRLLKPKGISWEKTILENVQECEMVYFVHSFAPFAVDKNLTLAQTEYGGQTFSSVVVDKNVMGTQFHPEKSADVGQRILKSFINL